MKRRLAICVATAGGVVAAIAVALVVVTGSAPRSPQPLSQIKHGCNEPGATVTCITLGVTWPSAPSKR